MNMLALHKPARDELWFRQELLADPATMSYNDAWGGAIAYPEDDWDDWYDHWLACDERLRFYRYLFDAENAEFVGEVAYRYSEDEVVSFLNANKDKLNELAQFLYEKETITGEEFMNILNSPSAYAAMQAADNTL